MALWKCLIKSQGGQVVQHSKYIPACQVTYECILKHSLCFGYSHKSILKGKAQAWTHSAEDLDDETIGMQLI